MAASLIEQMIANRLQCNLSSRFYCK